MFRRPLAAGAAAVALLAVAAVAHAQGGLKTFTDAQNRFSFQHPANLPVDVVARPNQPMNVLVGAADYECQMFVVDRPELAAAPPEAFVRSYSAQLSSDAWKKSMDGFALYNRAGIVTGVSVDTAKFWPVQRADIRTDEGKPVIAAMQARPGLDVWQFCTSFDDADHAATFNQIIATFAGPNDAALQAQGEAAIAARGAAAAEAAAAAAAAEAASKGKKGKNR
ncbi:MAG: hypothetical protein NW200_07605 [Hyphomonadaceae bacterium]|nr:hypothetical protein [Hyphomonadaceae bacterium]